MQDGATGPEQLYPNLSVSHRTRVRRHLHRSLVRIVGHLFVRLFCGGPGGRKYPRHRLCDHRRGHASAGGRGGEHGQIRPLVRGGHPPFGELEKEDRHCLYRRIVRPTDLRRPPEQCKGKDHAQFAPGLCVEREDLLSMQCARQPRAVRRALFARAGQYAAADRLPMRGRNGRGRVYADVERPISDGQHPPARHRPDSEHPRRGGSVRRGIRRQGIHECAAGRTRRSFSYAAARAGGRSETASFGKKKRPDRAERRFLCAGCCICERSPCPARRSCIC